MQNKEEKEIKSTRQALTFLLPLLDSPVLHHGEELWEDDAGTGEGGGEEGDADEGKEADEGSGQPDQERGEGAGQAMQEGMEES